MVFKEKSWLVVGSAVGIAAVLVLLSFGLRRAYPRTLTTVQAAPIVSTQPNAQVQAAMWEVAKVFGRSSGCSAADPTLGRMVAEAALKHQLDPRLVAATVAVESSCDPYAASTKGAIGLMQVRASTWKNTYDFQRQVNLLNPQDNLETGTDILAGYIKKYGKTGGITQYQGTGTGCPTCDGEYTNKILRLSDGK